MGIKTLISLEDFFKTNKKSSFLRNELREMLQINWYTLNEALKYLKQKKIITEEDGRYQWRKQ